MEINKTQRGFDITKFTDAYGGECSLQKSSSAMVDRIWFGVNNVNPQIMAYDAIRLGIPTDGQTTGWVPFKVPHEVLFHDRMHLDQDMIHKLMPYLTNFEDTGELTDEYYDLEFDWCNEEYLTKNGYGQVDYVNMVDGFESDIERLNETIKRMEQRKINILKHLTHVRKALEVVKELKEKTDGQ